MCNAGSAVTFQDNAQASGVYAARVDGQPRRALRPHRRQRHRVEPSSSSYSDYREYARGAGWKVWVGLPGNPPFQQASTKGPLPVPTYTAASVITVPDSVIN